MNIQFIHEAADATHKGTWPFPQVVGKLIEASVEYYLVDYVQKKTTYYSAAGETVTVELPYSGLPKVADKFDAAGLKANILDSQTKGQKHIDFSQRAMAEGVQSYYAFLAGKRVTYLGRQGDSHTEWFPGAKPKD